MMEEVTSRSTVEYILSLPPKVKQRSTTLTQITNEPSLDTYNGEKLESLSSMHSLVLNSKAQPATVFIAASQPDRSPDTQPADALSTNGPHVVTIRINTEIDKPKAPKISSVHLKSDAEFETFKISDICKKNSLTRLNVDEKPKVLENEDSSRVDRPPFINCSAFMNSMMTNMVMSSGQCSPSDTLDSGTCSDLDATPPPLPKKKSTKKSVSVTVITPTSNGAHTDIDYEDNESNLSCDSLNSSELSGSIHTDENQNDDCKKTKQANAPPIVFQTSQCSIKTKNDSLLPQGLLQDIRDRSAKFSPETECESNVIENPKEENIIENANISKESAQITLYRLVTQYNNSEQIKNTDTHSLPPKSAPLISESTYEERKQDKMRQEKMCYSSNYFDTDKYYDFHLNEKQFDIEEPVKSVNGDFLKINCDSEVEYFAGVKDYKNEEAPSTIKSSKGTIRGVKNRVRAGIATFLQMQNETAKSYKEKDAGKIVVYTTTMGVVRSTYQRCVLVKKILRNLLVKYEERDVFMSIEYQDEIRERMKSDEIMLPQIFIDGYHVGDADMVEKLNESGELRKMLKPYKSPDACNTCQMCGGFRLLPCRVCNGSKKSLHRNHFTAEFVALKCMNCDEVGLVRCEACS